MLSNIPTICTIVGNLASSRHMTTIRKRFEYPVSLDPFPEGWFYVASRQDLRRAKSNILRKTWMGVDVIVWIDGDGRICVADSTCPHMGADLGPDAGGRISQGQLVCPFHGFQFDGTGQCVATPYADPPGAARLRVFPAREIAGLIFAWWGLNGQDEPRWDLPAESPDQTGWCSLRVRTFRFPGHPQETTENSVDLAHLRFIHGYDSVTRWESLSVDGHLLESQFDFLSKRNICGVASLTFNVSASAHIYGLGYSYVEIHEKSIGMDMRMWILASPVDGVLIDMTLASQVREIRNPKRVVAGLRFLPVKLRAPVMNRFIASSQDRDVKDDIVVWSRKKYLSRPRLCRSDGEVMPFRAYCAQFYPQRSD